MEELTPSFLLTNEDLVAPLAPWCVWLDNLDLCILLLAQPWVGGGLLRAELEQQLDRIGTDFPVGPIYFQRVNRATAALVDRGQLESVGGGRRRRFATTARGFAALLLNLQVLRNDPTIDGSDFELKRSLVTLWNLMVDRFLNWPQDLSQHPDLNRFFVELEKLELWARPIVTDQMIADAFNILRLIESQKARVEKLASACETRLQAARKQQQFLSIAYPPPPKPDTERAEETTTIEQSLAAARLVASSTVPKMSAAAGLARYRAYLGYLDELTSMYANELEVVDFAALRTAMSERGA